MSNILGLTQAGLIIVIVLAIISLAALGTAIYLLIRHFNFRNDVVNVVLDSMRIQETYGWDNKKSSRIEKLDEKVLNAIAAKVLKLQSQTLLEDSSVTRKTDIITSEIQESVSAKPTIEVIKVLYASAAKNATSFYEIKQNPFEDTIFKITIDSRNQSKGTFEVADLATSKVLGCKDHLEGCCTYEGDGQKIQTIAKGEVSFNSGDWVITKPLHIKFI